MRVLVELHELEYDPLSRPCPVCVQNPASGVADTKWQTSVETEEIGDDECNVQGPS